MYPNRTLLEPGTIVNVHHPMLCEGEICTIHNMTEHSLRGCPQMFNNADRHMYRICPHMNFYLDPDERSVPRKYVEPDCDCYKEQ